MGGTSPSIPIAIPVPVTVTVSIPVPISIPVPVAHTKTLPGPGQLPNGLPQFLNLALVAMLLQFGILKRLQDLLHLVQGSLQHRDGFLQFDHRLAN